MCCAVRAMTHHQDVRIDGLGAGCHNGVHPLPLALLLNGVCGCIAAVASHCTRQRRCTGYEVDSMGTSVVRKVLPWCI